MSLTVLRADDLVELELNVVSAVYIASLAVAVARVCIFVAPHLSDRVKYFCTCWKCALDHLGLFFWTQKVVISC